MTTHNGITYLVEKLQIHIMPSLVLINNRNVIHKIQGFDELGGIDTFSTNTLAYVLGNYGIIDRTDEEEEIPEELQQSNTSLSRGGNVNSIRVNKSTNIRRGGYDNDE